MNKVGNIFHRYKFLLLLILFVATTRVLLLQMIGVGGADPIGNWFFARQIFHGLDYEIFHRSARFGTIIPLYLSQLLFGDGPLVYYVAPVFASIILSLFQYKALRIFNGELFSFIACVLTAVFPEIIKRSSHPGVEIFSTTFCMIALYYILKFEKSTQSNENCRFTLGVSSLFVFFMYMAKEDSLFLFPILLIYVWSIRKDKKDLVIFMSVPFLLFVAETFLYATFSDFPIGRLSVITSHVSSDDIYALDSLIGLFGRFSSIHMDPSWQFSLFLVVPCGVFLLYTEKKRQVRLFVWMLSLYLFLMTFLLKSINPIIPFNAFRSRYLTIIAPIIIPIICFTVVNFYKIFAKKLTPLSSRKNAGNPIFYFAIITGTIICSLTVIIFGKIYKSDLYQKTKAVFIEIHPLRLVPIYREHIEYAQKHRLPFVLLGRLDKRERYRPVFEKIDALIDSGLTIEQACIQYGISLELYKAYINYVSEDSYSGLYFIHKIFWHPKDDNNIYNMNYETIRINDKYYRIVFQDKMTKLVNSSHEKQLFVYVPYNPFKVLLLQSFAEIERANELF